MKDTITKALSDFDEKFPAVEYFDSPDHMKDHNDAKDEVKQFLRTTIIALLKAQNEEMWGRLKKSPHVREDGVIEADISLEGRQLAGYMLASSFNQAIDSQISENEALIKYLKT